MLDRGAAAAAAAEVEVEEVVVAAVVVDVAEAEAAARVVREAVVVGGVVDPEVVEAAQAVEVVEEVVLEEVALDLEEVALEEDGVAVIPVVVDGAEAATPELPATREETLVAVGAEAEVPLAIRAVAGVEILETPEIQVDRLLSHLREEPVVCHQPNLSASGKNTALVRNILPVCSCDLTHVAGDWCETENDCDHDYVCRNSVCARPPVTSTVIVDPAPSRRPTQGPPVRTTVYVTVYPRATDAA